MKGFLRYGESIVVYANLQLDDETKAKLELNEVEYDSFCGFLSTKGFLDKKIYFQTVSNSIDEDEQTIECISNFRDFVFTVTPKLRYEFNNTYQELKVEFKKLLTSYKNMKFGAANLDKAQDKELVKQNGLLKNFERRVEKARQRALKEDELNQQLREESAGELVHYGDEIQLMHRDSHGFLVAKNECSKTEQIGYKLEISTQACSRMIFSFNPRYKSHKIGDAIQYGDNLRLTNIKNENNLAVAPLNIQTNRDRKYYDDNPYIVKKYLVDPKSNLHTAFLGGETYSTWKIFLYSRPKLVKDEGENMKLEGGDLIRIKHSELLAYLCSSICFYDQTPEVYFRQYFGKYIEENYPLNSIWEINLSNSIFQGKKIECESDKITLRHFNSGRMIKVETEPLSGKTNLENLDHEYENEVSENAKKKLTIIPVQKGMRHLEIDNTYRIRYDNDKVPLYLSYTEENLTKNHLEKKPASINLMKEIKFTPLEDEFFDTVRSKSKFKEVINVEEAYIFSKISAIEKRDILYLRSSLSQFLNLSNIYKQSQKNKLNNQLLVEIEELIKRLISFLYDVEFDPDDDYLDFMDANEPLNTKQIIFKDLNCIEILVDLIHYPFYNSFYSVHKVHDELYAPQVISLCYSCIRYAIMEYRPSELYASQWLNLFIEYSLGELNDSLKANETLTELIDNNKIILEKRIKKSTIHKFVNNLVESGGEKKFVDILRAICICNEEPMKTNQNIISILVLNVKDSRERLILPLVFKGGEICARDPWTGLEQWIPLKKLKSESEARDDGRFYNFYCSSIFLMSDLCQDRNYTAIDMLKNYYSVRICIEIIISDKFGYDLRSAFCNLTENMWINANPFIIVSIPSNLKIWSDLNHEKLSKTSTKNFDNLSQYKDLTKFIFDYLDNEKSLDHWENSAFFMLQILKLCFTMFKLGFFNEKSQFEKLLKSFVKILTKTDKICEGLSDSESGKIEYSKIEVPFIIINIKKKICEMIKMMLTVQNDFKLSVILQLYKDKYESKRNQSLINADSENEELLRKSTALTKAQGKRFSLASLLKNSDISTSNIKENEFKELFEADFDSKNTIFIKKESKFISLLQQQTLYKNKQLKSRSLDLIYSFYKTSANLSERIREIQILDNANQIEEYKNLEEIRNYLFRLGETIEVWYLQEESRELNQLNLLLRRLETNMHSIRKLNLGQDAIEGTDQSEEMNEKIEDNLFLDTHLKQAYSNINKFSQDLTRNSSCLGDIIEILYHISEHDRHDRSTSKTKKEIAYYCHLILAEACFENVNNKKFLSEHFEDLLLNNLEFDSYGYNVIVAINSLLHNNREILFDQIRVKKCLQKIFDQFLKEERNKLRLAYYMFTLQNMIYFNSFSIRVNQNFIISNLISTKTSHIFKNLFSEKLYETLQSDLNKGTVEFDNQGKKIQFLNDDLCFDLAFMELISNCSFDKNAFAENISQTIISSQEVLKTLKIPNKHVLFEYELYKFIFHVYVETERALSTQTQNFLFEVMKEIKVSFGNIMKEKWDKNTKFYFLTHKELVSDYQVKVDLCNLIILNLKFFIKEVCKESNLKIERESFKKFVLEIKEMVDKNGMNIENEYAEKKLHSFKSFLDKLTEINRHFKNKPDFSNKDDMDISFDDLLSRDSNPAKKGHTESMNKLLEHKSSRNLVERKLVDDGKIENPFVSKLSKKATIRRSEDLVSIFRQSFMHTFQKVNLLESSKTSIFQVMSTMYFQSKDFTKLKNKEFNELILSESFNPAIFNNFLESLIKYIDPKNKQKGHVVQIGLAIFKQFVVSDKGSSENIREKIRKKKNRKKWRKKKKKVKEIKTKEKEDENNRQSQRIMKFKQDFLVKIGIVRLLCKIIIHTEETGIVKMALEVCNQLMAGGNKETQNEFLKVFKEMSEEKIILRIKTLLETNFKKLSELMVKENTQTMKKMIFNKKEYDLETSDSNLVGEVNSICVVIIQFFQLLCEGQNKNLQNYIRVQFKDENEMSHNSKNVNILNFIIELFGAYVKFFNSSCHDIGNIILEFMMEAIQGPCQENQKQMMQSKVLDFCKDFMNDINSGKDLQSKGFVILDQGEGTPKEIRQALKDKEILDDLFTNTIQFLLSLMEGNSNYEEIELIGQNVKIEYLLKKLRVTYLEEIKYKILRRKYPRRDNKYLKNIQIEAESLGKMYENKLFDDEVLEAFDIFFFIQTIQDHSKTYNIPLKKLMNITKEAYDFFKHFCGNIELIFQNKLQKVYFVKHPATMYLNNEDKENLMNSVRRDNINEKLSDFLERAPPLFDRMDHSFSLDKRCGIKPKLLDNIRTLAFLVAFAINIYMLFIFEKRVSNNKAALDLTSAQDWGIWFLGVFHLALSFIMIILQFLIHTEFHYYNRLRDFIKEFKKMFIPIANTEELEDQLILSYLEKDIMKLTYYEKSKILSRKRKIESGNSKLSSPMMMTVFNLKFYISDGVLRYFIFYFICSFCAIYYENYVLYSLPLFEIINRDDTLQNVIKATYHNGFQLFVTGLLFIVITYVYALIGYFFIVNTFWNPNFGASGENQCMNVFQCFFTILSLGPRSSGGIGDMMTRESYKMENRGLYYVRLAYDVTCFYVINIILMNIFFGIIIDTFAELRNENTTIEENKKNFCFICSLPKHRFDKTKDGYDFHVTVDHDPWNYLFYLYHLKKKDKTDFTGIDTYVQNMKDKDDHFWLPIERALVISKLDQEEATYEEKMTTLCEKINNFMDKNDKVLEKKERRLKLLKL